MHLLLSDSVVGLFLQVLPVSLLVGLVFFAVRLHRQKKQRRSVSRNRELLLFLFVCYVTGLANLVLVPANFWRSFWYHICTGVPVWDLPALFSGGFNFLPTFVRYLTGELTGAPGRWILTMLAGNLLMFVPMGVFLPLIFPRLQGGKMAAAILLLPLAVELWQPVVGRSFDTDDLLLNTLGILAGWAMVRLVLGKGKR
ncbi:MAG: VanZ family protein [Oscillospiraceae bacterium]|nr:VanZ family protein [Oscillospiraceae bacterium]